MKLLKYLVLFFTFLFSFSYFSSFAAPSINDIWWNGIGYEGLNNKVNKDSSLIDNVRNLFFPSNKNWAIWDSLRTILVGILVIFFIRAGALFVLNAWDEGELKKAKLNIVYLFYGAFLIFASTWLLWTVLNVWWESVTASDVLKHTKSDILVNILVFFKTLAYFVAFVMVVYYGFKIMQAQEKEDKIKAGKTWALNVILALIWLKILDYLYYIAQQSNFRWEAQNFLTATWKVLGWILWVIIILALIYSGVLLVTSRWNEEAMKKAKTIIRNVFLVIFIVFLFIVIVYDIVKNLNF